MVSVARRKNPEPLSTWIERTICLPAGTTAEPGPIRLYSYQRGIAAAIGDPSIARVTVIKSARRCISAARPMSTTCTRVGAVAHEQGGRGAGG
jgi:phage terminase large subunit GpA-like protein